MTDVLKLVQKYEPVLLFSKDGEGGPERFFPLAARHYVHDCGLRRRRRGWERAPGTTRLKDLAQVGESKACYLAYAAGDVPEGDVRLRLLDQGLELARAGERVAPEVRLSRETMDEWVRWAAEDPATTPALEAALGVPLTPDVLRGEPQALAARFGREERRLAWEWVERHPPGREAIEWLGELEDPSAAAALEAILGVSPTPDTLEGVPDALAARSGVESVTLEGFAGLPDSVLDRARWKYQRVHDRYAPVYHYHVCEDRGYRVLQYWFLYAFNDWAAHGGYNDHEGDWEMVCVFLDDRDEPRWVACSRHVLKPQKAGWKDLLEADRAIWQGTHPVVYVGCGSHANYLERKTYRYWSLRTYYDYAEGNGASIGPLRSAADQHWGTPIRLDDKPWNRKFAGKWGALLNYWLGLSLPGTGGPTGPARKGAKWNRPAKWAGIRGL